MNDGPSWWAAIWRWFYVLWICRVAAASAAVGLVLLAYTVQARDMFADLALVWWQWAIFFVLVFAWAWIVHGSARHALQHDDWVPETMSMRRRFELQECFWLPALWIPRILSILVFAAVGFAVYRTLSNLGHAWQGFPEAARAVTLAYWLIAATIVVALIYFVLIWKRRRLGDWQIRGGDWRHEPPLLAGTGPIFARLLGYPRTTPPVPLSVADWLLYGTRALVLLFLVIAIIDPHLFASRGPRLFFVPVLLGGAVVLLGEVGAWSLRLHTPLLLVVCVVSLLCVFLTTSFHDTRWIEATAQPSKVAGAKRQIELSEAVDRWKAANGCPGDVATCPRPILIAGAGGASRAGFYTATVVGALIDLGLDKTKGSPYGDIRSRIFALSTVSGSSAGAMVMRAAMLDAAARNQPDRPPCKTGGSGSWFGQPLMAVDNRFDPRKSWRDCFQAILAGDFLSPIFVALAYRDNFPFINPLTGVPAWSDRAVLLEQALEQRYHRFTSDSSASVSCPDQSPKTGSEGLCRPFGYHPDPVSAGAWVPLFFINGTSVFTGRRIVVGDVATTSGSQSGKTFMPLAYDLYDVRERKTRKDGKQTAVAKDVRLSTVATMSARFPVISPQGLLRTLDGGATDQIVDGGYFENDGLATITDLAKALTNSFGLKPVVFRIVNAPAEPLDPEADKTRPPPPSAEERSLFDDVFAIARALVASSSGHEDQYAASLRAGLDNRVFEVGVYELAPTEGKTAAAQRPMAPQANPVCRREVNGKARMEQVSMSWWMSQPVQAYLDAQLCVPANWQPIECELREGRTSTGGDCTQGILARKPL
jgi:hypothetical protein